MSGSTIFESQVPGLLRRVRRVAGLSQRALAEEIGVSKSVVARWETGQRLPSLGLLEQAAALADLRLVLVDDEDRVVPSMRADGVRTEAGRRPPPFTDPRAGGWRTKTDSLDASWTKDRLEARRAGRVQVTFHRTGSTPSERLHDDHPTDGELLDEIEQREQELDRQREAQRRVLEAMQQQWRERSRAREEAWLRDWLEGDEEGDESA
jgi:transcriptional regulator with XRE-family HTH domain